MIRQPKEVELMHNKSHSGWKKVEQREREREIHKKIWPMMIVLEKGRGMRRRKEQQEKVVEGKEKRWHYLSHNFARKLFHL